MLGQTLTIARNTLVESIRQPIFILLIVLAGVFQFFLTWMTAFSMGMSDTAEVSGDNKLLLDLGMGNIFVFGTLLAAFIATAVVSREIERKTILTVVSKPTARPLVVIGKYLGAAGAILLAVLIMILFLLMAIRHGVMSTAADTLDGPVLVFTFSALAAAALIAAVGNYLYNWAFSQTMVLTLLPAMLLAYLGVILVNKEWAIQPVYQLEYFYNERWRTMAEFLDYMGEKTDELEGAPTRISFPTFRPQVTMACAGLAMAILVLTSVAVAASTRFGQVMTIVICAGVFLAGLLTNSFLGRFAFRNTPIGIIRAVEPLHDAYATLSNDGDTWSIRLESVPTATPRLGEDSFYWAANPSGASFSTLAYPRDRVPTPQDAADTGIVVTESDSQTLTITNIGGAKITRPPQPRDYAFLQPTRVNPVASTAWLVVPNLHYFWLLDAVSQNVPVPPGHLALIGVYGGCQIVFFLSLAIILFQKRDVG